MDEARSYYIRKHTNSQNVEMVFPSILPDHIEIFSNYVRVFDSLSDIRQLLFTGSLCPLTIRLYLGR